MCIFYDRVVNEHGYVDTGNNTQCSMAGRNV